LDTDSLLDRLHEDGLFGCQTFSYKTLPLLSRDLLDSINELYFLDRELGLFDLEKVRVLDIGAGYGRSAHRMSEALPRLEHYYCVDAVPESTFLCEFYTGFRGCRDRVSVVPLDEVRESLPAGEIDLAVNIHSFSETSLVAIAAWLDELRRLHVPRLLIVPNDADNLWSFESDGSRRDYAPLLDARGYRLRRSEPTIRDDDLCELLDVSDQFLLFEHVDAPGGTSDA
jgi:SAM-dependent methyltransferase